MPLDERPLREFVVPTWDILTNRAPGGASISYGDLVEELIGKRIRFPDQAMRPILDFLCGYCVGTGAPPLSVLVVNGQSQEPGPGFLELVPDIEAVRRDVRDYNWETRPIRLQSCNPGLTLSIPPYTKAPPKMVAPLGHILSPLLTYKRQLRSPVVEVSGL